MTPTVNSNHSFGTATTVGALLRGNDLPRLEHTVLLAHVLQVRREILFTHPERELSADQAREFAALVRRRQDGEPIAYLVGTREFFGMELRVTPDVLIPRPDTELLVESALARLPESEAARVLDLGTGSGAIAIAIARHRPAAHVDAFDLAPAALDVAAANAALHRIGNVRFVRSDWYAACDAGRYDVIVSNPPYIPGADPHLGEGDLRFEPAQALSPGEDGLAAIRTIVSGASARLVAGGWLLIEHGHDQAAGCRDLFAAAGFLDVRTRRDLAGVERVCEGRTRPGM